MAVTHLLSAALHYHVQTRRGRPGGLVAREVAARIKNGGMIAQKVAQIVASRPDIVADKDLLRELRELQSRQIATDVHQASIATVTIDRTRDVAVKRLNDESLLRDGHFISGVLRLLRPFARRPQFAVCVDMLETLSHELDFESEGRKNATLRDALAESAVVVVPETIASTRSEVVMRVVDSVLVKDLAAHAPLKLVNAFFRDMTAAAVRTGVVHLDLHAGNVGLTDDGRVVVYDMGSVRTVDPRVVRSASGAMLQAGEHLFFEDWGALARHLVESDIVIEVKDVRNLRLLTEVSLLYARGGATSVDIGMCLREIKGDVNLHPSVFQLVQSVSILEGCCKVMNPRFNVADAFGGFPV
jgi:predicted unusual protein kinase regulating ubiquinone biosynthesis (AarF/ABC1/UbiB family)